MKSFIYCGTMAKIRKWPTPHATCQFACKTYVLESIHVPAWYNLWKSLQQFSWSERSCLMHARLTFLHSAHEICCQLADWAASGSTKIHLQDHLQVHILHFQASLLILDLKHQASLQEPTEAQTYHGTQLGNPSWDCGVGTAGYNITRRSAVPFKWWHVCMIRFSYATHNDVLWQWARWVGKANRWFLLLGRSNNTSKEWRACIVSSAGRDLPAHVTDDELVA